MRRFELLAQLPEITERLATASGIDLQEARRHRPVYAELGETLPEPTDPVEAELFRLRHVDALEQRRDNLATCIRIGSLARFEDHLSSLTPSRQREVARAARETAATVIYEAATKPVTQSQRIAMGNLVDVVSWHRRWFARRAVNKTVVTAQAA